MLNLTHKLFKSARNAETEQKTQKMLNPIIHKLNKTLNLTHKLSQKTQKMLNLIHKWNKMLNLTHKLFKSAKIAKSKPKNTKNA